ncbi:Gfo/Idh/MocA family oxidoreductase [Kineococcus rhizosphaerae]|uniref:Myo-inositol 2-dehydrogenase/D-chiro-inositol 1-dehydrogenase n=1 Tax=Kineococcus rhizosphaerae TaxID=559628 RepID=A0A2T0R656_9ACTN|nr:Gfo/Idh/MocA family oxidoreductase [Kineococcus rhizosphaerae]PRY16628.1 myo-inositol 2-dehydrogenase/D-chiro-inositol 1-dehydrogenase [Kineococcus rhizosphaerae]
MSPVAPTGTAPTGIGLVGAGRIGSSHARLIATRVPNARLVAVADVRPGAASALAGPLGAIGHTDVGELLADPEVEAVVVTAVTEAHAGLVEAAAHAGKGVFCEKPAGLSLAEIDRGIAATTEAGVAFQVGFNRRFAAEFAAARAAVDAGRVGTPQLLRSLTRDPGLVDPAGVPPWTIFLLTLIHDFDTLLFLNPGAEPVSVYAVADALVAPGFKDAGLLDTAVVTIRFDNGALATAEASFSATYGYDVRGEVFGSGGRLEIGGGPRRQLAISDADGRHVDTPRGDTELFPEAYAGELAEFAAAVREGRAPAVTGHDARRALSIALSCIASVRSGGPVDPAVVAATIDGRVR